MKTANCPKCNRKAAEFAEFGTIQWYRCEPCDLEFNLTEFERANQAQPSKELLAASQTLENLS